MTRQINQHVDAGVANCSIEAVVVKNRRLNPRIRPGAKTLRQRIRSSSRQRREDCERVAGGLRVDDCVCEEGDRVRAEIARQQADSEWAIWIGFRFRRAGMGAYNMIAIVGVCPEEFIARDRGVVQKKRELRAE
jgi:hypothetical protein